ncbi:MAG: putative metalloprotease CJM1_0395 family protein [Halothiobacillaceae bacterium]
MDFGALSGFSTHPTPYNPEAAETIKRAAAGNARSSDGVTPSEYERGVVRGEAAANDDIRSRNRDETLDEREQAEVEQLAKREREVVAHENAHRAAGAGLVRGGSYDYESGPDGKRYIVGGEVRIDTSPVPDDPAATIRKADQIIKAALAPADPSPADRAAASDARAMRAEAQRELRELRQQGYQDASGDDPAGAPGAQVDYRV